MMPSIQIHHQSFIMKNQYALLMAAAFLQPLIAQIVVEKVVTPAATREVTIIPLTPPPLQTDTSITRRHLLTLPRDVTTPAHPPGTVVETTETKSFVDVPGQPRRIYNVERNVVIVEGKELPYITIPVLFEKETAHQQTPPPPHSRVRR
jgi:hypothetical protein